MEYQLKYLLKVHDPKYREFLNVLESSLNKPKLVKCTKRTAFQSIIDIHIFEYKEVWTDIESLKEYMNSDEFMSMRGAFQLLTRIKDFSITESKELEKAVLLNKAI